MPTDDLFAQTATSRYRPLADRMRPTQLEQYIGQSHLLAQGKALKSMLDSHTIHSMIFWGPPGVGKTSLALLISQYLKVHFISLSAVLSGVKEIRAAIQEAEIKKQQGIATLLFIDEVHRFNKSQQDAFLPHVENGTVIFIGATTENPSFELNNALLSRARVFVLKALEQKELLAVLHQALKNDAQVKRFATRLPETSLSYMANFADGDARRALNTLELACELLESDDTLVADENFLANLVQQPARRFDKGGDIFYEQISALHKSVRGSSPDAALYWFVRMIDGGCDPLYLARRILRMASEDIGNADPRALTLCLDAWNTYERLGSPEGELALAQAVVYLASAPKSNAVYEAYNQTRAKVAETGSLEVPLHLRNAPSQLMKNLNYGAEYHYAHHHADAFVAGENYFPEALAAFESYKPVERGLEVKIKEKLAYYRALNQQSSWKRY